MPVDAMNHPLCKSCLLCQASAALLAASVCFAQNSSGQLSSTNITAVPACEANVSRTCEVIYYPANTTKYYNLMLGILLRFPLINNPNLHPWISTGFAYHYFSWDNYWYYIDGSAPFMGAGLDINVGEQWDIRFEVNHTGYDSADSSKYSGFNTGAKQFGASLVYSFQ